MPHQAILSKELLFKFPSVAHDRVAILRVHIDVLPLDIVGRLTGEVEGWVSHAKVRKDHVSINHIGLADMAWLEGAFTKVALILLTVNHILFLVWNAREILIVLIVWDLFIIIHLLVGVVIDNRAWHLLVNLAFTGLILFTN